LKEAVSGFNKVIAGKSTIPVLGCVRLDAGKDGIVAQATNLDEVVEYRFDGAEVRGEGGCIIPLSTLKDLAKGTKSEQVEIEAEDPLNISLTERIRTIAR
jgi:DNA polymerase III sliding clamp (beta) subunit (PCNA family)